MSKFGLGATTTTPATPAPTSTGGSKFGLGASTPAAPASPFTGLAAQYAPQLSARNVFQTAANVTPAQRTQYLDQLVKDLAPSKNAQERGQLRNDLAASLGWSAGAAPAAQPSPFRGIVGDTDPAVYQRAVDKQRAGQTLTTQEAQAMTAMQASQKALTGVGVALQPFFALSDITKGLLMAAKTGDGGAVQRGFDAAAGHLTYGAAEYLPGVAGARARGVTGEQLLKGTKYEGDKAAALWVELLADPSILLMGAGLVAKGGATAGRLASLEKLAKTPEGAARIRGVLNAANQRGNGLLRASDEVTGVPVVARAVAGSKPAQAVKVAAQKLADTSLPATAQRVSGARTYGDLILTPDQKLSIYTPEQLARDEFRTTARIAADDTRVAINAAVNPDAKFVTALTNGLKPADAKEAARLLGVFTNATDPNVAEIALRKIVKLGEQVGKNLEQPFVAAVKATDRIGQQTVGPLLKAEGLPVILDPAVTKAIQEAETGADLLPLIGKYVSAEGRPRGILMTQYAGRADVDKTIAKIAASPPTPAKATVEIAPIKATLDTVAEAAPVPMRPVEPVGIQAAGELPVNPAGRAVQIAETPVNVTPPFVQGAARQGVTVARSPQEVLADLFGAGPQTPPPLKPFEPARFEGAETTFRGERQAGEYAGLAPQLVDPTDAAGLKIAEDNSDLLYVSPDRDMAEGFGDTVREVRIAPANTLDLSDVAPNGTASSVAQVDAVLTKLGVPPEDWAKIKALWGAGPEWEAALKFGGVREAGARQIYDLFRDEPTGLIKNAVRSQGADAVRFGPEGQREVIVLDRSRSAEVLPDGTLKPTSPDVVPYNTPRQPAAVLEELLTPPASAAPTPAPMSVSDNLPTAPASSDELARAIPEDARDQTLALGMYDLHLITGEDSLNAMRVAYGENGAAFVGPYQPSAFSGIQSALPEGVRVVTTPHPTMGGYQMGAIFNEGRMLPVLENPAVQAQGITTVDDLMKAAVARTLPPETAQQVAARTQIETPWNLEEKWIENLPAGKAYWDAFIQEKTGQRAAPAVVDNVNPAPVRDLPTNKTPAEVLRDLINPAPAADGFVTPKIVTVRNNLSDLREAIKPTAVPERMVEKNVPTTYRTVQVEANAIDWGGMDNASRRAVLNSIEGGSTVRFARDASGALRAQQSSLTVPLNHPIISHYIPDADLELARYPGTPYGERIITRREKVPEWYNPRDPAPMDVQRALREQAQEEAYTARYAANNFDGMMRDDEPFDHLAPWMDGNALASVNKINPAELNTRAAMNEFASRVMALNGRAATKGEVFAYRMALSRYRQASNVRQLDSEAAAQSLEAFVLANPEATLTEAAAHLARTFDLGTAGKNILRKAMAQSESGFSRQMSRLERLEFAQKIKLRDTVQQGTPGGMLLNRLLRKPEDVSAEFKQVFPLEENALKVLDEQVRTRSAAIIRSQSFRQYHEQLRKGGEHLTARELDQIRRLPVNQLTPDQRALRERIASATEQGGVPAGWKIMDRSAGPFEKGDAVPWWAYHDLFGASSVDDAAVAARILQRGSFGEFYDRGWRSMNAFMLGAPTSIINDQVGQYMQMALWGVTPDAIIEGMVRRATATQEQLKVMQEAGIGGTSLESSIQAGRLDLTRAARKLDGDSDLNRLQRVLDTYMRWTERGVGLDPTAMTGAAGVVSDVAHAGSGYLFRVRSRMSDWQRESLYFHRLQLGDTSKEAAAYTNQVMMDMRLAPAYARVVGKVWPFFNWIAMSGPRSIITVLRKPSVNAAAQRVAGASDDDSVEDAARRVLSRDRGWLNLNLDERNQTRIYLDPRSWDPTNTLPQLIDFRGTKIGVVSPPWWATLALGLQNGTDRFGGNIYAEVLDGQRGGFNEAARIDRKGAWKAAAKFIYTQFTPTYAPGSTRAKAFAASVIETSKLPQDGSRDIAIAHTLMGTEQGKAFLSYMQSGNLALIDPALIGNRGSEYSDATASMARTAGSFLLPLRGVNADQNVQGTAAQALNVGVLNLQNWLAGERKRLGQLEAGGATPAQLKAAEDRAEREYNRRASKLDTLDTVTR